MRLIALNPGGERIFDFGRRFFHIVNNRKFPKKHYDGLQQQVPERTLVDIAPADEAPDYPGGENPHRVAPPWAQTAHVEPGAQKDVHRRFSATGLVEVDI